MNLYIFIFYCVILLFIHCEIISTRSVRENPSHNDKQRSLQGGPSLHPKKRAPNSDRSRAQLKEAESAQKYRKYDSEEKLTADVRRSAKVEKSTEERDSDVEDIPSDADLQAKVKKAVAAAAAATSVENDQSAAQLDSNNGQSSFENDDKYQESQVSLKQGHQRKRTARPLNKRNQNPGESESQLSSKQSNAGEAAATNTECPPRDESSNRETSSRWTQEQINALSESLTRAKDDDGEVENVKNLLYDMGLVDKRAADADDTNTDEDLNNDNVVLKRNDAAEAETGAEEEVEQDLPQNKQDTFVDDESYDAEEAKDKRDASETDVAVDVKQANSDDQSMEEANEDVSLRDKRQNIGKSELDDSKIEKPESNENYAKRMEAEIQEKIDAIKEKVKREILKHQRDVFHSRKRRDTPETVAENRRQKRTSIGKISPEKRLVYEPYQSDDEEAEDGEFDDNKYDGRMDMVDKRSAANQDDENVENGEPKKGAVNKESYEEGQNDRNKRENSKEMKGSSNLDVKSESDVANDYFGALPEMHNGELPRAKRVKRE